MAAPRSQVPTERTENFRAAVQRQGGGFNSERLVQLLKQWDQDGDGKFGLEEVVKAARELEGEQRKSRNLTWVLAAFIILYLATLAIFLGMTVAANELSKDYRPDVDGRLTPTGKYEQTVSTREALDSIQMFDFLDIDFADLYKAEAIYLEFNATSESGRIEKIEKFYKIAEVSRNPEARHVEIKFESGEFMTMSDAGANLYEAGATEEGDTIAVFKGPEFKEEASNEENKLTNETIPEDQRRLQAPTRFGTQGGRANNIFFNTGRLYDRGIVDIGAGRFQALAVRGRCLGSRFQCRSF